MSILKNLTRWLNRPRPERQEPTLKTISLEELEELNTEIPQKTQEIYQREKPISEIFDEWNQSQLEALARYVKENFPRLKDPDYIKVGKMSPQWSRGYGDDMYYQLPNRKVIAIRKNGKITFDPGGLKL